MNIPNDNILKLKCSECDCFLSRIPIYLKEDGSAICGRCPIPNPDSSEVTNSEEQQSVKVFRMKPYENLIENIQFPCMYKNNGCTEEILCSKLQKHEENCEFRPYVCPILPIGTCDWIGCKDNFYNHCESKHSERILQHPCVLEYDITKNSTESYVTKAFDILFLIHTKVCLNTHKIYHSVHYLDYVCNVSDVYFELIIQRGYEKVVKRGKIEPLGCKTIKENLSVSCGINSLIEILGGFDETNFTIKIMCTSSCKICDSFSSELVDGKYCQDCDIRRTNCKYSDKGCTYNDIDIKTDEHENSVCKFAKWCWICEHHLNLSPILTKHYEMVHNDVIFNNQNYWNVTKEMFACNSKHFDFIINSKYDKFFCTLFISEENYLIELFSSTLNTAELNKLKCAISIKNKTKTNKINLKLYTNARKDWSETFPKHYLFSNNCPYQIKVDITKKD